MLQEEFQSSIEVQYFNVQYNVVVILWCGPLTSNMKLK